MKKITLFKFFTFLILFISGASSISYAQTLDTPENLESFDFLIGKWEADFGKFKYYEEWQKETDKLSGNGYRIKESQKFDGGKLLLINIHGYISYIATVGKQQPILFALVKSGENKYVFENKEHDFPQRIIYQLINNDTLQVLVEGNLKGEFSQDTYNMIRVTE